MERLEAYRAKRDFRKTKEPSGKARARSRSNGGIFVVHKHAATRLHYDLRLEHDGVLWSWAVTRGPSLDPSEKRLAVHVEDHPLEYGGFEGTIPRGEYGGGTVIVWDRGTWTPVFDEHKGYAKGHLEFELHGEKELMRLLDETIPLEHGLIGQETTTVLLRALATIASVA